VTVVPEQASMAAACEAAGRQVLATSDALLAIWDGKAVHGQGGTAAVVERARLRRLPFLWVQAGNRIPGIVVATQLGATQGSLTIERLETLGRNSLATFQTADSLLLAALERRDQEAVMSQ